MPYRVIFDVSQQPMDWHFPAFGLLFVGVGLLLVLGRNRRAQNRGPAIVAWLWLGFASLWTAGALGAVALGHHRAVAALESGQAATVEGQVENFVAETPRHQRESFSVNGTPFSYSQYVIAPGFRQTSAEGGPLRNGVHARLAYLGNQILRVEVGADTPYGGPAPRMPKAFLVIPILLPLGWSAAACIIATVGGWRSLAAAYPAAAPPDGAVFSGQSLQVGLLGAYGHCMDVAVGPHGIYCVPTLLFKFRHPPILIPWSAVSGCEGTPWFLRRVTRVAVQKWPSPVRVFGQAGEAILEQWVARQTG